MALEISNSPLQATARDMHEFEEQANKEGESTSGPQYRKQKLLLN